MVHRSKMAILTTLLTALLVVSPSTSRADDPPNAGKQDLAPPGIAPGDMLRFTIYGNGTSARIRGHTKMASRPLFNLALEPKPVAIPEGHDVIIHTYNDSQMVFLKANNVHKEWTPEQRVAHELAYVAAYMTGGTLANRSEADTKRRAEKYAADRLEAIRPKVITKDPILVVGTSPLPRFLVLTIQLDDPDDKQVSCVVEIVKTDGRVVGVGGLNLDRAHADGQVFIPVEAR